MKAAFPPNPTRKHRTRKGRNVIECMFCCLEDFIAAGYDKRAGIYLSTVLFCKLVGSIESGP